MKILDQIKNLLFGKKAEEAPQTKTPDQYTWPEDREQILQLLDSGDDFRARAQAVTLLPYPEERERIIRIAKEDRDDFVRDFAIEKLRWPDDRDVLAWKMTGAGGGGYLLLVVNETDGFLAEHPEAIRIVARRPGM